MAESKINNFFKKIFDTQKEGKGVERKPRLPLTFGNFFKYYGENITMLMKINFLYVFGNFPVLFALFALTGYLNKNAFGAASTLYGPLYGAITASGNVSPASMALFGIHGVNATISTFTVGTYIFFGLACLVIFTMGPVNAGCTHLIRSVVRGDPIFFIQDFKNTIKKNFWQSEILGIVDCVAYAVMIYNVILSYFNNNNFVTGLVFYGNLLLILLYSVMRFYTYLMLITFDLKTLKIYKNALIFSILNTKRNLMAVSGIAVSCLIVYVFMYIFLPLGVIIPFVLLFSTGAFMACYAAYPKVKEIMIDPYYETDEVVTTEDDFTSDNLN